MSITKEAAVEAAPNGFQSQLDAIMSERAKKAAPMCTSRSAPLKTVGALAQRLAVWSCIVIRTEPPFSEVRD